MSVTYGFYNSVGSDRQYDSVQMSQLFDGLIADGVYSSIGTSLMVTAIGGLNVSVGVGRAWFNHTWTYNDAALTLPVTQGDAVSPRIDVVVLEIDGNVGVRANRIFILPGTPGVNPSPPALTNVGAKHQYPLAHIAVAKDAVNLIQANITNKVGTVDCPFVLGLIDQITTTELLAQWESEFDTWFATIVGILDQNAAGNLLNLLTTHTHLAGNYGAPITPATLPDRTRKFFVPVQRQDLTGAGAQDRGIPLEDGLDKYVHGYFAVPEDFVSTLTVSAIVIPAASGNVVAAIDAKYSAVGELATTHSSTSGPSVIAVTLNQRNSILQISLGSAAKGDLVDVEFSRNGGSVGDTINNYVYIAGFLVSYTADI